MENRPKSRLADLRRQRRISQTELAEKAGLSQATVSRLERGEAPQSLAVLAKVARALSIPVRELAAFVGLQDLFQEGEIPGKFVAICPNPLCSRNERKVMEGGQP